MVGLGYIPQQTPLSVTEAPPSELIFTEQVIVPEVTLVTEIPDIIGGTMGAGDGDSLFFLHETGSHNNPTIIISQLNFIYKQVG